MAAGGVERHFQDMLDSGQAVITAGNAWVAAAGGPDAAQQQLAIQPVMQQLQTMQQTQVAMQQQLQAMQQKQQAMQQKQQAMQLQLQAMQQTHAENDRRRVVASQLGLILPSGFF